MKILSRKIEKYDLFLDGFFGEVTIMNSRNEKNIHTGFFHNSNTVIDFFCDKEKTTIVYVIDFNDMKATRIYKNVELYAKHAELVAESKKRISSTT